MDNLASVTRKTVSSNRDNRERHSLLGATQAKIADMVQGIYRLLRVSTISGSCPLRSHEPSLGFLSFSSQFRVLSLSLLLQELLPLLTGMFGVVAVGT